MDCVLHYAPIIDRARRHFGESARLTGAIALLHETASRWIRDRCDRLGAAVSYYAIFSIFPLLLLSVTLVGYALGEGASTRTALVEAVVEATGAPSIRGVLDDTLRNMQAHRTARGVGAVIGLLTLLFGASKVFSELNASLNLIWRVPDERAHGTWRQSVVAAAKAKLIALGLVLAAGLLLIASLVVSTGLDAMSEAASGLPWGVFELVVSTLLLALTLAAMFRTLPRMHIAWSDVAAGALLSAVLLTVLKKLLAWYLAHATSYAAYGAVGAMLGLLVLIYLSSLIVFLGAELSRVYAERFGSLRGENGFSARAEA
jgi:membrane protein